ncbi:methyltransferase [Actinoplanes sp. NPDC048791]|uniref:methyltransferase n=1 Tax=Actinoplanes sp. NPDC048791 TaxID=3154623 RepID=UPI0033E040CC
METRTAPTPAVRPLLELSTAFWRAKVVLTGVELGLFTALADGPAGPAQICERLGLNGRAVEEYLDSLTSLGMLERTAQGYRNSAAADAYLVEGRPGYLGGWMRMTSSRLYEAWSRLPDGLRTGEPQLTGPMSDNFFPNLYQDLDALRRFISGMDSLTNLIGPDLAGAFDWSATETFIDIGGARGNLASVLAQAHPHLRGGVFDLPHLKPLFEELTSERGVADRLQFHSGDFFADPLPEADVLVFGHILHDWNDEQRRSLLDRAFQSVRPGGAVLIYDRMIDDAAGARTLSLLGSVNLLLVTPGGSEYRVSDCRDWLHAAGFDRTASVPLLEDTETVVIGRKPVA